MPPAQLISRCTKLDGDSPDLSTLPKARAAVHLLGGLEHIEFLTCDFYLALVGAVGWELVPAIPAGADAFAELVLPEHLRDVFRWTRGIVIPMAILSALRPDFRLPEHARVNLNPSQKAAFNWGKQLVSGRIWLLAVDP